MPIDVPPIVDYAQVDANLRKGPSEDERREGNERYILIGENLAVLPGSDRFVTETDTVVVRFITRKALACRMTAESDPTNKNDGTVFRIGGQEGISDAIGKFVRTGGATGEQSSCGFALQPMAATESAFQYAPASSMPTRVSDKFDPIAIRDGGDAWTSVDFRFGPFTSDEVVFHVARRDRTMAANDVVATIKIPNHKRYAGWFDVWIGANVLNTGNQSVSLSADGGSQVRRIRVDEQRQQLDVAMLVKFFVWCSGGRNKWRSLMDLREADVCVGLSSGLSVARPTRTFYPIGLNVTLGGMVSLHGLLSFNRIAALSGGFSHGDPYFGDQSGIPTHDKLSLGFGIGIAFDPTIFATLIKGVVVGK